MNIEAVSFRSVLPKLAKIDADAEPGAAKPGAAEAKQAARDAVLRHIAEMQSARAKTGEDNPRVRYLIGKFESGRKLTWDELAYLRIHAPGRIDSIEQVSREREVLELSMRSAPSKMEVQLVAARAAGRIAKHPNSEEGITLALHLSDAQHEYMKTDEYQRKPAGPAAKQPEYPPGPSPSEKQFWYVSMAITAYERAKFMKSTARMF